MHKSATVEKVAILVVSGLDLCTSKTGTAVFTGFCQRIPCRLSPASVRALFSGIKKRIQASTLRLV